MDDCEKFLAQQETWVSAVLKGEYESPEIPPALAKPGGIESLNAARDEYERLLKHCPKHLREYREREKKLAVESRLQGIPSVSPGRPRQDDLAQEAAQLAQTGLSQPKIADELNRRHPNRLDRKGNRSPVTEGAVRKMLSRGRRHTPDKT